MVGDFALDETVEDGHVEVAKLLLEYGADVELTRSHGVTTLHDAASFDNAEFIRLLIKYKVNVNRKDFDGETALYIACSGGYKPKNVQLLLKNGAEVDIQTDQGDTPLFAACYYGVAELVKTLLKHGADVNHQNKKHRTPLFSAARNQSDVVELLLEKHDVQVDHVASDGRTPLFEAADYGKYDVAKMLLDAGASKTVQDNHGNHPVDVVCNNNWGSDAFVDVATLLLVFYFKSEQLPNKPSDAPFLMLFGFHEDAQR